MNMSQREAQADINQFREGKQGDDASMVLQSSGVVEPLFSWFQEANKVLNEPIPIETGCHQEMFLGLRDGVQQPTSQALVVTEAELLTLCQYKEEFIGAVQKSNGTQNADMDKHSGELKRKQNNERPKRTRSAEVHNMSEKRRRERIRVKMRALQELIPNSHKGDKASMLDDVIEYLKALKKQVEMLSIGRNALFQVPYMSSAGIQGVQLPQFPPFLQMRPNPEMGMLSICGSIGFPMMPPSSAYLHPSIWATAGWHLMAIHGSQPVHQIQVPFVPSQPLTAVTTPFAKMPISSNKFCKSSSCPNQGYSGSQTSGCRTTGC